MQGQKFTYHYAQAAVGQPLFFSEEALQKMVKPPKKMVNAYTYGFNGMEKDDEVKGRGNSYDFGARMHDPRLGRFLSIDPKASDYPYYSPYLFAGNKPIAAIDKNGEEEFVITMYLDQAGNNYKTTIEVYNHTRSAQQIYHVQTVTLGTTATGNNQYTVNYVGSFDNSATGGPLPPESAFVQPYINNVNYLDSRSGNILVQGLSAGSDASRGRFTAITNTGGGVVGGTPAVVPGAQIMQSESMLISIPNQAAFNVLPQNVQDFFIAPSHNSVPRASVAATQRTPVTTVKNNKTPRGDSTQPPRVVINVNNDTIISN